MTTRLAKLASIRNPRCTACALHASSVNVCVMGRGLPHAKIMLIGEAPGEAESKTGLPFMGAAGKLLDGYLRELGMESKVYITNVAKCRPPENRKPKFAEVKTCGRLYLKQELNIIEPRVIVLMGRTPIDYYFDGKPFKRNKAYHQGDKFVIPTYHPAYYLHSGANSLPLGEVLSMADKLSEFVLTDTPSS